MMKFLQSHTIFEKNVIRKDEALDAWVSYLKVVLNMSFD